MKTHVGNGDIADRAANRVFGLSIKDTAVLEHRTEWVAKVAEGSKFYDLRCSGILHV